MLWCSRSSGSCSWSLCCCCCCRCCRRRRRCCCRATQGAAKAMHSPRLASGERARHLPRKSAWHRQIQRSGGVRCSQACRAKFPNTLPLPGRIELMRFHMPQQRRARSVLGTQDCSRTGKHPSRHLPLTLRVVLVAHVEQLEELDCISPAHIPDRGVRIENSGHVQVFALHGRFFGLKELSHLEAVSRVPDNVQRRIVVYNNIPVV
mmetsp:Transcript_33666/g.85069  ORF Transcript_33666/g.85069 Transcript_33666/m.85069 type:complete len:206 (-) Transcript_33666:2346-2963(-)